MRRNCGEHPDRAGEFLGASAMPALAGYLADKLGLVAPVWMTVIAGVLCHSYFSLLCGNGTAKGSKNENQTLRRRLLTAAFQGKTAECNAVRFICYFND